MRRREKRRFSATSQRMKVLDVVKELLDIIKLGSSDEAGIKALRAVQLPHI